MDNLSSQVTNLFDLVEPNQASLTLPVEGKRNNTAQSDEWRAKEYHESVLERAAGPGPCVGDDAQPSDLRLKHHVHRVGTTVLGLPLYRFKYRGKPETYEGVMAQDVLQAMPRAVSMGADGYYRVNYSALGTRMRRVS
jgi:hypothetical protein